MEYKIKDLVVEVIDNRGKNPKEYLSFSEYPIIDNYLIKNEFYPDLKNVNRYVSKETYESFIRNYSKKNDVLVTMVGNGIGNVTLMPNDKAEIIQNTIGLRCNNELMMNEYLYYYLKNINDMLKGLNRGSSQPSISKNDLLEIKVSIPKLSIQKKVINILTSIDLKIHNNKNIINSIENISSALFEQYFLKYEFPNEQGLPYRSSGGEMVESELGEIPKGWEVVQIQYICEANKKSLSKKDNWTELNYLDTGNITGNSIDTIQFIDLSEEKAPSRAKRLVQPNDIVFSTVRPNQQHYGIIKEPVNNMVVSTGFAVLSTNVEYSSELLYMYLTQQNMMDNFQAIAEQSTSAYPAIKAEDILKQKILKPTKAVLADISKILSANFNYMWELQQENKKLAQLRDTLIPKLLSGEIEIPDESVVEHS